MTPIIDPQALSRPAPGRAGAPASTSPAVAPASAGAQLIYTSFDDGAGRGGWQVKQVRGEVSAATRDALVGRVKTRFDLEPRLPDFPTEAEIAARPSRLAYAPLESIGDLGGVGPAQRGGAYWHTSAAGPDASGRPGNVFAHIALDRTPPPALTHRPITRWGSPDWLRPYGPADVAAAEITDDVLPQPNPAMSARAPVEFLTTADVDRIGVFRVLLDAVVDALDGGPTVVLLVSDHTRAASWIAAVSYFLPLRSTYEFAFTTHDRADAPAGTLERSGHLVVAPADSLDERTGVTGAIVIDEAEIPRLGDLGSTHHLRHGTVEVSSLSTFVEGILEDDDVAATILARRDAVAAEFADTPLTPVWPLAVAVAEAAPLSEFHDDALRVVASQAPAEVMATPWAATLIERALARHPLTPTDTLPPLITAYKRGHDTTTAAARLLSAILADDDWLRTGPLERLPPAPGADLTPVRGRITALLAQRLTDPVAAATLVIRLSVVIYRLGRRDPTQSSTPVFAEVTAELRDAWARVDVSVIWAKQRPANLQGTSVIDPVMRAELLRPALLQYPREYLSALMGPLWVWLFADDVRAPLAPPAGPSTADLYLYPIAVAAALRDAGRVRQTTEQRRAAVTAAVDFALADPSLDDGTCRAVTDDLITLERPAAADMVAWAREQPRRTSPTMLHDHVFYAAADPTLLHDLAMQRPDADPGAAALITAARLRGYAAGTTAWPPTAQFVDEVGACLADPLPWDRWLAEDLRAMLYAGLLTAQSHGAEFAAPAVSASTSASAAVARLAPQRPESADSVIPLLSELVRREILDIGWVAARSFLRRFEHVASAPTIVDSLDPGWAEAVVTDAVGAGDYRGPMDADALRDASWSILRQGDAATAQRFFAEYPKKAATWLYDMTDSGDASPSWLRLSREGRSREDR